VECLTQKHPANYGQSLIGLHPQDTPICRTYATRLSVAVAAAAADDDDGVDEAGGDAGGGGSEYHCVRCPPFCRPAPVAIAGR